jgi:hypothetical protein
MKYIKLFEDTYSDRLKQYLPVLKSLRSTIPLQNVIEWLNGTEIDYANWGELDMYIYYIENFKEEQDLG